MADAALTVDGGKLLARLDELGRISEAEGALTRMVFTLEHRRANALAGGWMREAGMRVWTDAIGNLCGRYEGNAPGAQAILLASHLDTVRDAGRFDGMAGVIAAIGVVEALHGAGERLDYAIEIIGFSDEEGTRYGATMLGSRAVAGSFDEAVLALPDEQGKSMAEAMRDWGLDPARIGEARRRKEDFAAYLELHIEQGPVLESLGLAVGVVTAISGAVRLAAVIDGMAGHAGTVPMAGRRDALVAAADCVLAIERIAASIPGVVATVGRMEVLPGAVNVIPGRVKFTVDVRSPVDADRDAAVRQIKAAISAARNCEASVSVTHTAKAVPCDQRLIESFSQAISAEGYALHALPSGAGHDAMVMAEVWPVGMVFVRCAGGISHNPAEDATADDLGAGAAVLLRAVRALRI